MKHVKTTPYHQASNGLAKRALQTFKKGMKKMKEGSIETKVSHFLFQSRITPQGTTGVTPAELMMNRKLVSTINIRFTDTWCRTKGRTETDGTKATT